MMTGQPYKSPEAAAAPAAAQEAPAQAAAATDDDGTQTTSTTETTTLGTSQEPAPALVSPSAAAFRGVSTVSARLRRQRLANQLYKDAWAAVDPSLGRALTPRELRDQVAPRAGLEAGDLTDADLEAMMGGGSLPADGEEGTITCKSLLVITSQRACCIQSYGLSNSVHVSHNPNRHPVPRLCEAAGSRRHCERVRGVRRVCDFERSSCM